jgi:hypothetical protein
MAYIGDAKFSTEERVMIKKKRSVKTGGKRSATPAPTPGHKYPKCDPGMIWDPSVGRCITIFKKPKKYSPNGGGMDMYG